MKKYCVGFGTECLLNKSQESLLLRLLIFINIFVKRKCIYIYISREKYVGSGGEGVLFSFPFPVALIKC